MKLDSIDALKAEGFIGFKKIEYLFSNCSDVPCEIGNYMILYLGKDQPQFLVTGSGGFFKGKDPNKPITELETHWVSGALIVYIGQAGGIRKGNWSEKTLNDRISLYMKFGQGKPVGHWGGRFIWQIQNYRELVVCWKPLPNKTQDPRKVERELVQSFISIYDNRPFANLQR